MKLRLAALLLLPLSGVLHAEDEAVAAPYVSVLGGYLTADYASGHKPGYGVTTIYGLPIGRNFNLELNGYADRITHKVVGADYIYGGGADLQYMLSNGKVATFIIGGIGVNVDDVSNRTRFAPRADAGAGIIARLTSHLALRTEARYYPVFNVDKGAGQTRIVNDARFNLGLQYSFGTVIASNLPVPRKVAAPEPAPAPAAAPEPAPVPAAAPAPVVETGTVDTDGDGVVDSLDQCPDTPKGLKVDAKGCIVEQTVVLRAVNFDFGADQLTAEAKTTLDLLARSMILQKSLTIEIAGHTDSLGPQSFNLLLSQKRAAAVKEYLVSHGVEASRLVSEGYGEFNPIADNNTEAGRATNRRVEFKVLSSAPKSK